MIIKIIYVNFLILKKVNLIFIQIENIQRKKKLIISLIKRKKNEVIVKINHKIIFFINQIFRLNPHNKKILIF